MQFNGQDKYSDGMAVFLLTSDDVARNYGLEGKCRLLRPMPLDKSRLPHDLTTFITTQVSAKKTGPLCLITSQLLRGVRNSIQLLMKMVFIGRLKTPLFLNDLWGSPVHFPVGYVLV